MSKKTVIFVVETGSLAGGVRVIGELANRLSERGWPVQIYSVNPRETIKWFPLSPSVKWLSFCRTGTTEDYGQLTAVLAKQDALKVATFWRTAYPVKDASKPGEGLYLCQDWETSYTSQPAVAALAAETYDFPLTKITTSRWVLKQFQILNKSDFEWIGIGLSNFYKPPKKENRNGEVVAVARRQALKGYGKLMEFGRCLHRHDKVLTTFGLDERLSPITEGYLHIGRSKGIDGKIQKLTDHDVRNIYWNYSVFASTSSHEGFSLTPLESMACGLPVVKTLDDGSDEYIEHGENCLVSNEPIALADHAVEILRSKTLADKLKKGGYATASRYKWQDVMDRLEKVLDNK